jgi:hypothetical protein
MAGTSQMNQNQIAIKKRILRAALQIGVVFLIFFTAHIVSKKTSSTMPKEELNELKREINAFWELQQARTYKINKAAENYIQKHKLKPNDPLPPNTFYLPDDKLWSLLFKPQGMQITSTFEAKSKTLRSNCAAITTIQDKVPTPPEKYAYCGILWSSSLMQKAFEVYPKDQHAIQKLLEANKEIEEKQKANLSP